MAIGALAGCLTALIVQQRHAEAEQARNQRFVDTATQTVVNMFSYKQDNIDESVNRFVNGTSGPLRGMLGANNVDNLKGLFRATNASSEAVINGAALEGIDNVEDNASVLVSVWVTVADADGANKPSMPYRLRVIVHEDETGKMTGYDLEISRPRTTPVRGGAAGLPRHRGPLRLSAAVVVLLGWRYRREEVARAVLPTRRPTKTQAFADAAIVLVETSPRRRIPVTDAGISPRVPTKRQRADHSGGQEARGGRAGQCRGHGSHHRQT